MMLDIKGSTCSRVCGYRLGRDASPYRESGLPYRESGLHGALPYRKSGSAGTPCPTGRAARPGRLALPKERLGGDALPWSKNPLAQK